MKNQKRVNRGSPSGRLRIVAGKWRSRLLPVADEAGLRPTAERIRETLFNWLAPSIEGAVCLDLFAGTGALGLEALSRGAASVVFVEKSRNAVRQLRDSASKLQAEGAIIHEASAFDWLSQTGPDSFDIVFLDPPFADGGYEELCRLLAEGRCLKKGAHVYLEQDRSQPLPVLPQGWQLLREKTAGNVRYSLVRAN